MLGLYGLDGADVFAFKEDAKSNDEVFINKIVFKTVCTHSQYLAMIIFVPVFHGSLHFQVFLRRNIIILRRRFFNFIFHIGNVISRVQKFISS